LSHAAPTGAGGATTRSPLELQGHRPTMGDNEQPTDRSAEGDPMTTTSHHRFGLLAAAFLLALGLSACGDDDSDAAADTPPPTTAAADEEPATTEDPTEEAAADGETIAVTAVDYSFEGLPETIEAGSRLTLTNEGQEPHELVAMRIPDDEARSVEELLALPEEELFAVFGGEPEPATVLLAAPGETDMPGAVVGDGTLTEPGRYAILCFIPVGSDASVLDPDAEGPPASDSPPHAAHGMWAELTVQ
jgi:plastocyanin